MELKVIAYARNGHTDKFGIPRQSRDESPILTRIVFEPEYAVKEALRGIEGYSHLWLIWGFSDVQRDNVQCTKDVQRDNVQSTREGLSWSPTVRPPRLGGNKRMGVFATRSPFRPNPIGLSSVKLVGIQQSAISHQLELIVSGADVLDGTPIYDIKPYLAFSDCHEDATNGFAEENKGYRLAVNWEEIEILLEANEKAAIEYILSQDPRPGYQNDPEREYKMDYAGWNVTFIVKDATVFVKKVEKTQK